MDSDIEIDLDRVPARAPSAELDLTIPQRTTNADSGTSRKSILKDQVKIRTSVGNTICRRLDNLLVKSRDGLPNEVATVHPTNLKVAEYSQRVMTGEV